MLGQLATILMCLIIGSAPLALGGNRPLPWAYNAVLAGVLAIVCAWVLWHERKSKRPLHLELIAFPAFLWALGLGWGFIQLLPLGIANLSHPAWNLASVALDRPFAGIISVSSSDTLMSLMRMLTYLAFFLAAFVLARDTARAAVLLRAFVFSACVYAVYGLLRYATGVEKILWFDQAHPGVLTSVFVNRNTAATYFGLAASASLGLLMRRARHLVQEADREESAGRGLDRLVSGLAGGFGLEFATFFLLLTVTVLTQSRAGVAATGLALMLGLLFQFVRNRRRSGGGLTAAVVLLLALAGAVTVFQLSGARVVERLFDTEIGREERLAVAGDTIAAISDHALTGSGLGTFQDLFPYYREKTKASDVIWDKAHNDYLEVLLGLGIPAGFAIILGIALLVLRSLKGTFERRRNSHMPMAGVLAGVVAGTHAVFDFSLQIQAVALSMALLLGIAVAQSKSDQKS